MAVHSLKAALVALACGSIIGTSVTATAGPSGLPWPSGWDCWEQSFDTFRGRASDAYVMFVGRDSRTAVVNSIGSNYIKKFAALPGTLVLSFPMLTKEIKYQFAACAAGQYDQYVQDAATNLGKHGLRNPIVRLGWEPNGTFYWSVGGSKWSERENYKQCFRRQAEIFRDRVPGVQIEWDNRRKGALQGNVSEIYPGNAYVDIIGVMLYDRWDPHTDDASWDRQYMSRNATQGLQGIGTWLEFAKQNGKKFSVPEWAISNNDNDPSSRDNPYFIRRMYKFFQDNADDIAFEAYFNCGSASSGYKLTPDTINPNSRDEYARVWQLPPTNPNPGDPVTYQAEDARLSGATRATTYGGYSGEAYVDYENRVGSYVEWQVDAPSAGSADLTFRYANGSSTSRPVSITVNGIVANGTFAFPGTGGWGTWKTKTQPVGLNSGRNTVRAQATGSTGGPHMDRVNVRLK